jgi:prepilin-type N-terminal cleavage/methylation domain-containing protein
MLIAGVRGRSGFTLVELALVMTLLGSVLALVVSVGTRLQRELLGASARIASTERLRDAVAILPLDLRILSAAAGDLRPGEARDSALEFRSTIGAAIVCASTTSSIVLAPALAPGERPTAGRAEAGDTLWLLVDTDSAEHWRAFPIRAVGPTTLPCSVAIGTAQNRLYDDRHPFEASVAVETVVAAVGTPARITRPARYSLYRASDDHWYLGLRTWSASLGRFNQVQPLSGPYHSPALAGSAFRYFDSTGARLPSGTQDTRRVARVEVVLMAERSTESGDAPRDSLVLAVALRNRR